MGRYRLALVTIPVLTILAMAGPTATISTAQLPTVRAPGSRPDVLLVVADDQRADTLRALPTLMRQVAGHGVRFHRAFVPVSLCCPARASLLTGRHAHTTGVWSNVGPLGYAAFDESSTLATWLDDAGYRTGLFGKYLNHWSDADPSHVPPGWDEWFALSERCCQYFGFTASVNGVVRTFDETTYSTTETARRAAAFIRDRPDAPTFVVWAPTAPHAPATPEPRYEGTSADLPPYRPPSYLEPDVSDKPRWVRSARIWDPERRAQVDDFRRRQFESLRSVDDGVGELLSALADSGRLSNTLIVYLSDNGVLLGEHRLKGKPFAWEATHRVPLVVRFDPLVDAPRATHALVLSIDVAPTIAELTGIEIPTADGRSLVPLLGNDRPRTRLRSVIEHGARSRAPSYCGVRSANALFVRYATGEEEFYDYRHDPWELQNAVDDPATRTRVAAFRRYARHHCVPPPPGFAW